MTIEAIRNYCLTLPGVTEDIKWGDHLCFNIGEKMFLVTNPDGFPISASFKTTEALFEDFPNREGFTPAPYLARNKWIHVDDINRLDTSQWQEIIRIAYDLKYSKLTAKAKKQITDNHNGNT